MCTVSSIPAKELLAEFSAVDLVDIEPFSIILLENKNYTVLCGMPSLKNSA